MARSSLGETLVACLEGPTTGPSPRTQSLLARVDQEQLVAAADRHGVGGWVHATAAAARMGELCSRLEQATLRAALFRRQVEADLSAVAITLDGAAIPWLIFKGPVLDQVIHRPPGLRTYGDIDLLVSAQDLAGAVDTLEAAGAVVLDQNWAMLTDNRQGEVHLRLPYGSVADLHWHFLGTAGQRTEFRIDMADVLARRRTVQVGGLDVATLDAADTLIHTAFHAASHGGTRLLWLKDVEQCATHEPLGWDLVSDRCDQWRVGIPVATMLARTRHVLGLQISDHQLARLGHRAPWSTYTRLLDHAAPAQRGRGGRSLAGTTAAAASASQLESWIALAQRSFRAFRHPVHMPPPGPSLDRSDPSSPVHPTGGAEGRRRYFSAIAREPTVVGDPGRRRFGKHAVSGPPLAVSACARRTAPSGGRSSTTSTHGQDRTPGC